jgi:uncharacterized protein YegP (UPF0339 family)
MAGIFELFVDADANFRFRLTAPDGTVMAVSKAFDDKPAAVAGISAVREYAGMGLITDLCPASTQSNPVAAARQRSGRPTGQDQRILAADVDARARSVRRAAHPARWAGAA